MSYESKTLHRYVPQKSGRETPPFTQVPMHEAKIAKGGLGDGPWYIAKIDKLRGIYRGGMFVVPPIYENAFCSSQGRTWQLQAVGDVQDNCDLACAWESYNLYLFDPREGRKLLKEPIWAISVYGAHYDPRAKIVFLRYTVKKTNDEEIEKIRVMDLDGVDVMPPLTYRTIHKPTGDVYELTDDLGKTIDYVYSGVDSEDSIPCVRVIANKDISKLRWDALGKLEWYKKDKYNPMLWTLNGARLPYSPESEFSLIKESGCRDKLAKALKKHKNTEPRYRQVEEAFQRFNADPERSAEKARELSNKYDPARKLSPDEWIELYLTADSTVSIIKSKHNNLYGLAVNRTQQTVPCIFSEISAISGFPGVFSLKSPNGYMLSNGYAITSAPCYEIKSGDGRIELIYKTKDINGEYSKYSQPIYIEYADASGEIYDSNLEEKLLDLYNNPSEGKWCGLDLISDQIYRPEIKAAAYFYYALSLDERGGKPETVKYLYETAYENDNSYEYAKKRSEEIKQSIDSRNAQLAAEEAQRQAEIRQQRIDALGQFAAGLNQLASALSQLGGNGNTGGTVSRPTVTTPNSYTTSTTKSSTSSSTSTSKSKSTKPAYTSADISNRNTEHRVYMQYCSDIISMQIGTYPYSKGFTATELQQRQDAMREIRQKWEARGLWPYGQAKEETWRP